MAALEERVDDLEEGWVIARRGYVERVEATGRWCFDPAWAETRQLREEGVKQRISGRAEERRQAEEAEDG